MEHGGRRAATDACVRGIKGIRRRMNDTCDEETRPLKERDPVRGRDPPKKSLPWTTKRIKYETHTCGKRHRRVHLPFKRMKMHARRKVRRVPSSWDLLHQEERRLQLPFLFQPDTNGRGNLCCSKRAVGYAATLRVASIGRTDVDRVKLPEPSHDWKKREAHAFVLEDGMGFLMSLSKRMLPLVGFLCTR